MCASTLDKAHMTLEKQSISSMVSLDFKRECPSHQACKVHSCIVFSWHAGMLYEILIVLAVGGVASGLRSW